MLRKCRSAKPPHPYKPLGLLARPFLHRQHPFCLSTKSWGQVDIFPLPAGSRGPPAASDLHNFHVQSLNLKTNHPIVIYISCTCQWTPHLPQMRQLSRKFCLFKPLQSWESFPCHCCSSALSRDTIPLKVPYMWEPTKHQKFRIGGFLYQIRIFPDDLSIPDISGWLGESKTTRGSYGGLKLIGAYRPSG
jgi:hypothetical protein